MIDPFLASYADHPLRGSWQGGRECRSIVDLRQNGRQIRHRQVDPESVQNDGSLHACASVGSGDHPGVASGLN